MGGKLIPLVERTTKLCGTGMEMEGGFTQRLWMRDSGVGALVLVMRRMGGGKGKRVPPALRSLSRVIYRQEW
jgi:hypothetical protein